MELLTCHSSKGGVGKSTISVNLAFHLYEQGKNVCIIDYDFAAPNLHTFLDVEPSIYLNDFLKENAKANDCIVDITPDATSDGRLIAAFADPSSQSVEDMLQLNEQQATNMLIRTMKLKQFLEGNYNIDYVIFDTSPGIGLTVVNSFITSDAILFIIRLSKVDIEGTINMLNGFKDSVNNRTMVAVNLVPPGQYKKLSHQLLEDQVKNSLNSSLIEQEIEFVGWIPTDEDYFEEEFSLAARSLAGENVKIPILVDKNPDKPFSQAIRQLSQSIFNS